MTFLARAKGPLGIKPGKPSKAAGKAHMARVAQLPCVLCGSQPVEVHHVICGRYGQRKASDFETIPLCYPCHRGPEGIHASKAAWVARNGEDYEFLPVVADMLAGQLTPWRQG